MAETPQKLWFKRRRYGYGWTPVTLQGWSTLLIFLVVVVFLPFLIFPTYYKDSSTYSVVLYVMFFVSALFILIGVCLMKGPIPHWRWGKKLTDDPEKDL